MDTLKEKQHSTPELMWEPSDRFDTKLMKFASKLSEKYNVIFDNYWDLHKWSTENIEEFWSEIWIYFDIIHSKPYDKVVVENRDNWKLTRWFPGAQLNFAENFLRYRDNRPALILTGEDRNFNIVTYSQLFDEVKKYAASFKKYGLKKGDRVACYMSNREEAIFAMLGAISLGGIYMGVVPLYGAKGAINRLQQMSPKFLFTIDKHMFNNEEKDMISSVVEISRAISSLEKVIVVPSKETSLGRNISQIRNSCFLSEFLPQNIQDIPELEFEQVSFDFSVYISFTSGTTGVPKAIVYGCGSLLTNLLTYDLHLSEKTDMREEVYLHASPAGWVTWFTRITALALGSCIVLYEGDPFHSASALVWNLIDNYEITHIGLAPSLIDYMENKKDFPSSEHSLHSLKVVVSGTSIIKPKHFDFFYRKIKRDIVFFSLYGTTETAGGCLFSNYALPVYKGEMAAPILGTALRCFNEEGKSVEGEMGELVLVRSTPALLVGFWGDEDGSNFNDVYFSSYPGAFCMKDLCLINPHTRGIMIFGRSDEKLKSGGKSFGSSDIYCVVEDFPEISDSLCVSQYNAEYDTRNILFLKMSPGYQFTEKLIQNIKNAIKNELSAIYLPHVFLEVTGIPYNFNGKKMESVVKKLINKMPYNTDNIANPKCLKEYQDIPELSDF